MQTYWINKVTDTAQSVADSSEHLSMSDEDPSEAPEGRISVGTSSDGDLHLDEKTHRVVEWTTQSLMTLLETLTSSRNDSPPDEVKDYLSALTRQHKAMPLDELQEVISFPGHLHDLDEEDKKLLLGQDIEDQLGMFIGLIATKYPSSNNFHNFYHASHVSMSLLKMFSTIRKNGTGGQTLADPLARRISDPLVVFACALAAIIHDVDHPALPNYLFKHENTQMAGRYAGRCIAEQNSLDVAWNLLLEDRFKQLRAAIVRSEEEAIRFRQLVINAVIATDLFDGGLNNDRKAGWEKAAFETEESEHFEESPEQVLDRQATAVFEHLIQAADISHTMQHW